jgi:hypothetical protein
MGIHDAEMQIAVARKLTAELPLAKVQERLQELASHRLGVLVQEAIDIALELREAVPSLEHDIRRTYDTTKKANETFMRMAATDPDVFFITNTNHDLTQHVASGQALTFNLLYALDTALSGLNMAQTATANYGRNLETIGEHITRAAVAQEATVQQVDDYISNLNNNP